MTRICDILREVDYLENIKEIIAMMPVKYNLQESIDGYMNNGKDKYEAMQTVKDGLFNEFNGVEKCVQWEFAREQRRTDIVSCDELADAKSYEATGCYHCHGYDTNCNAYYTKDGMKMLAEKMLAEKYKATDGGKIE